MASIDDLWLVDFGVAQPGEPAFRRPGRVLGPPEPLGPGNKRRLIRLLGAIDPITSDRVSRIVRTLFNY